ncbi:MAG: hypothetical protein K9H64_22025 [Bacteroidales bacterium]|nr:hypothetical protein [Bacteroidales bacterium]MCF8458706.1 hypothetical protein [Bacteroidales bacterium]
MKRITILTTLAILFATNLTAQVWRVNNNNGISADFTTLQSAIDGASNGDTLYIEASSNSYGDGVFDKKLIVIGAGYWLNENDSTQANKDDSRVAELTFNNGSQGSQIIGLKVYNGAYGYVSNWKLLTINVDSISILKCYIYGYQDNSQTFNGYTIYVNGNRSNIVIQQNWILSRLHDYSQTTYGNADGTIYGIYFSGTPFNSGVHNNFIRSYLSHNYGIAKSIYMGAYNSSIGLIINNNVIWGEMGTYYTSQYNNIILDGAYNNSSTDTKYNNICNSTQYPNTNNNQQNINMDSVFVDYDSYIDNGYLLKPNSPAIGAGMNGCDCGAFGDAGGGIVYKLSGLPDIPAIFEATINITGTTQIPVNIKAKSNN